MDSFKLWFFEKLVRMFSFLWTWSRTRLESARVNLLLKNAEVQSLLHKLDEHQAKQKEAASHVPADPDDLKIKQAMMTGPEVKVPNVEDSYLFKKYKKGMNPEPFVEKKESPTAAAQRRAGIQVRQLAKLPETHANHKLGEVEMGTVTRRRRRNRKKNAVDVVKQSYIVAKYDQNAEAIIGSYPTDLVDGKGRILDQEDKNKKQ